MNKTCKLIKELREETGLTASEFSRVMGVSKSSISKWEVDTIPGIEHLYQIARYFRVTVDELLNGALNTDITAEKFVSEYDLSSFDVPQLIQDKNVEELVRYYKKCQNIKNRFLKLLPKAAYQGLVNIELAEYQYLSHYISVDSNAIKYEWDFNARLSNKIDKNEMEAVKVFYEKIKGLTKLEKDWEIEKIIYFKPKLYFEEIINSRLFEPFVEMFKLLPQIDKNSVLNSTINQGKPIAAIRNKYVLQMINSGAKVLVNDIWHAEYWSEEVVNAFDGTLEPINRTKRPSYYESNYYKRAGDCSYAEYIANVDEEKTLLLKEACSLRKNKPKEYYAKLKSGQYDALLDF